jgi:hypothetical protein
MMRLLRCLGLLLIAAVISACGAGALPVVPTTRPTDTPTSTPTRTPTVDPNFTPTATPTEPIRTATGGPSPTPLFGPTRTDIAVLPTATRGFDANAPRIEFFTSSPASIPPGGTVTLFWSTRGVTSAAIYRLERGIRNQVWNVGPDGSLPVTTRANQRGAVEFVLTVGDGAQEVQQTLTIPLLCPDTWFFQPAPADCPASAARETALIEEPFQLGRMIYVQQSNLVYALFNDGFDPAWVVFENRYDPAIHPESDPNFPNPPGLYQPLRILGFLWRGNDAVRNRLGLGTQPEISFNGFVQGTTSAAGATTLYISSADGTVLELLPEGALWQIITPP